MIVIGDGEIKSPDTDPLRCAVNAYMRGQVDRFNSMIPDRHRAEIIHKLDRLGRNKTKVDVTEILKQYFQ
jgi:hypothetical protein